MAQGYNHKSSSHLQARQQTKVGLYDPALDKSSCGVGFITRKDSVQTHDVIEKAHEALCVIPHRGGMSSEGVGDGAGVCLDLSVEFFRAITGQDDLETGYFGVGNFFMPDDPAMHEEAEQLIEVALGRQSFDILARREVGVNESAITPAARSHQLPIRQWVFRRPSGCKVIEFQERIYNALLEIEKTAFTDDRFYGLYPLSLSADTQVLKGRFNSGEIIPYFQDLSDKRQSVHTIYFHTRFSTNTAPHPIMAQPFRQMAHNGELNTDKKNRLSESAIAQMKGRRVYAPKGQSDSARLDQTLGRRLVEDKLDLVKAVVAMMPPAWENDTRLSQPVRDMLEYFSLYEEKNDGPAAVIFGNGKIIGARLDRLGLRPLRSVETAEYLVVTSEAGQISFPPESVLRRGRIKAGGMIHFDHDLGQVFTGKETLERLAAEEDYAALLKKSRVRLDDFPAPDMVKAVPKTVFTAPQRYVACALNQESFKFFLDPMMQTGAEKISAMGYGAAINALSDQEGGIAKYLSQRFAQVTNPPLDSLREADGMTLRVALGAKPAFDKISTKQIVIDTPILKRDEITKIRLQKEVPVTEISICYQPIYGDTEANTQRILETIEQVCDQVEAAAEKEGGIIILSDIGINEERAPLPGLLVVAGANNRLILKGLRFRASLVLDTGQVASSHHINVALGFGASAISPRSVFWRAHEKFSDDPQKAIDNFVKAANKALMKTMGKVGLCTAESYIGGEFFEPNFMDVEDPVLKKFFPNMIQTVGGVGFATMVASSADWHQRALEIETEDQIPLLGLFKERAQGAGHSYGTTAVRGFVDMTEEPVITMARASGNDAIARPGVDEEALRLLTINQLEDAYGADAHSYKHLGFDKWSDEEINSFQITDRYRDFSHMMAEERAARPSALRDVLDFPADVSFAHDKQQFIEEFSRHQLSGNDAFLVRGLDCHNTGYGEFRLRLIGGRSTEYSRLSALVQGIKEKFGTDVKKCEINGHSVELSVENAAHFYFTRLESAPGSIALEDVQPASEITRTLTSGAMSHGALVAEAHEAVAHGTNIAGGMSNSGEGGENISRFGTIRASTIKQLASGRFGVWAGYLADPNLEELEIKIAQGAKPGEGGQLPGPKVTVEIAAARGGTPGVELVSPPPHHDTYSIEDLAQLIHDAKAARVRVIVKLVSSEGIGTIAVGVAKAGADVINVAGNTGGTGAAAVTSLKNTGRAAEIGLAEVHQALCVNGIRQKVVLRCSGAHQTGSDVVKSALLGGDSFEFGTTALMMLKCVMAKNCNIKCPAGLTTNAEVFDGDPRALAQYLLNIAHEVREILARLGMRSLREARGRSDLLQLLDHPSVVGKMDLRDMLHRVEEVRVANPVYLEAFWPIDDDLWPQVKTALFERGADRIVLGEEGIPLTNQLKTVGGQLSIDLERYLQYEIDAAAIEKAPSIRLSDQGRRYLDAETITIHTTASAGQSYGAFCNDGMTMRHVGTCNDGVGKGLSGGVLIIKSPGGGDVAAGGNVLIGNFALFGAMGGKLFVEGEAGDRFAVRNSGAVAVVEGLGDFGCEYMTNGAVVNIGGFGKGFCNGMSGGFAYQYDPEGMLADSHSADSVVLSRLSDESSEAALHRDAVKELLEEHVARTGSVTAKQLLATWGEAITHFYYATPRELAASQDADQIRARQPRKAMVEELATALCQHQIRKFKIAYRDGVDVVAGLVPVHGQTPEEDTFILLNAYTVQHMAQQLALTRLKGDVAPQSAAVKAGMRKLILTEDFALMQQLMKYARAALAGYTEEQLAILISDKRLRDYKKSLSLRNVYGMHSSGTYSWLIERDRQNRAAIQHLPSFEELFAREATLDIAKQAS